MAQAKVDSHWKLKLGETFNSAINAHQIKGPSTDMVLLFVFSEAKWRLQAEICKFSAQTSAISSVCAGVMCLNDKASESQVKKDTFPRFGLSFKDSSGFCSLVFVGYISICKSVQGTHSTAAHRFPISYCKKIAYVCSLEHVFMHVCVQFCMTHFHFYVWFRFQWLKNGVRVVHKRQ